MILKKEFHLCIITNQGFLIPMGGTLVDTNRMIDLNEISTFIVKLIRERSYSEEELIDCIYDEYDSDIETIRRDLKNFTDEGIRLGVLE